MNSSRHGSEAYSLHHHFAGWASARRSAPWLNNKQPHFLAIPCCIYLHWINKIGINDSDGVGYALAIGKAVRAIFCVKSLALAEIFSVSEPA